MDSSSAKRPSNYRPPLRTVLTSAQVAGDLAATFSAYALSGLAWMGLQGWIAPSWREVIPETNYLGNAAVTGLLLLLVFRSLGLYREHHSLLNIREYHDLLKGWLVTMVLSLLAVSVVERSFQSRGIFLLVWLFLLVLLFLFRFATYRLGITLRRRGWIDHGVLLYGAGHVGCRLVERIRRSPKVALQIRGFLDDDAQLHGREVLGVPVLGGLASLAAAVRGTGAREVLVTMTRAPRKTISEILEECRKVGVEVRVVPSMFDIVLPMVDFTEVDGIPLIGMDAPSIPPGSALAKRLFDLAVSGLLLLVLSPILAATAAAVLVTDGRPVLFSQVRIGFAGRPFRIYKFRSMYKDAPKYAVTPGSGEDPRITPVGRFLRRTSLDELPQLFNVLRGEMSLVGPRPEMPFIVETYNELQRSRLNAKPGITGLWQISKDRAIAIHENMDYDIYYIRHQSFLLDLAILAKTAVSVVRGRGAW